MTIAAALAAITAYPIPPQALEYIAEDAGLNISDEATAEVRQSRAYTKAQAQVYRYLTEAPNISQGGISYTFSTQERDRFSKRAAALLASIGEEDASEIDIICGYLGEDF